MALRPVGARLVLEGQSGFIRGMSRASTSVESFESSVVGAGAGAIALGTTMGNLASGAITAVGRGLLNVGKAGVGFLTGAVTQAAALEAQMSGVSAVLGATDEELTSLKTLVSDLGLDPNLKVSALEAATAIEVLAKNGLSVDEILGGAARSTVALANATGADLAVAADIATDSMSLFGISAEDMGTAIDGITGVVTNSKLNINDYGFALANAGAIAAGAGISFEDFNTVITATASSFSSGQDAGTSFKTMIQRLSNPTAEAKALMDELGISLFDAEGATRPMAEVVGQLNTALGGMTDAQKASTAATLGGADASRTILALSTLNTVSFAALSLSVNAAGQAQEAAATRVANLSGAMDILSGVVEGVQLAIGDKFLPILTQLASSMATFVEANAASFIAFFATGATFVTILATSLLNGMSAVDSFSAALEAIGVDEALIAQFQGFTTAVGDVITVVSSFVSDHSAAFQGAFTGLATVLGGAGIAVILSGIATALGALLSPIGLVIIGAALLGAAWAENWGNIQGIATTALSTITETVSTAVENIKAFWAEHGVFIVETATTAWGLVVGLFGGVLGSIALIFSGFKLLFQGDFAGFGQTLATAWSENWTNMANFLSGLWDLVSPFLTTFFTTMSAWFAEQDWLAIATTVMTAISEGLAGFWEIAQPVVMGWFTSISDWATSTDWLGIATTIIMGITGGLAGFWALAQPVFMGWVDSILTWAMSVDWLGIATTAITAIVDGFSGFWAIAQPTFDGWSISIRGWFMSQDWSGIAAAAVMGIAAGFITLDTEVSKSLTRFLGSVESWFHTQDWGAIGEIVGVKLAEGAKSVFLFVTDTLPGLLGNIAAWFGSIDWLAITKPTGMDLINGIIDGVAASGLAMLTAISDFAKGVVEGFRAAWGAASPSTVMAQIGVDLILGLIAGVVEKTGAFLDELTSLIEKGIKAAKEAAKKAVDIGKAIIDGMIEGIKAKASSLASAAKAAVDSAISKAKSALGIDSPSRVFMEIGSQMIEGLVAGIVAAGPTVESALDALLGRGAAFGGFGFASRLKAQVSELKDELSENTSEIKDTIKVIDKLNSKEILGADEITRLENANRALGNLQENASRIGALLAPLQGPLTEFENAQETQAILNDQIDLFKLMRSEGLKTSDILDGLTFGVDIKQEDFVTAQARILEQVNKRLEVQLTGELAFGEFLTGLEELRRPIEDIIADTVQVSGAGGGIANFFQDQVIGPLETAVRQYDDGIARATEDLLTTTPDSGLANFLKTVIEVDTSQRALEIDKIADAQQRLLDIQKQQQQLDFLGEQQKLLDLIAKNELDAGQILQGLELGINANASGLLDAMSRALGAVIEQTNQTLQIASPSKVFERIGMRVMEGLQLGIQNSDTFSPVATASQIATTAINNVNNREINIQYTNNSGAPLADAGELDFLLASYA